MAALALFFAQSQTDRLLMREMDLEEQLRHLDVELSDLNDRRRKFIILVDSDLRSLLDKHGQ